MHQQRRLTGLAAKAIEFRDKIFWTTDHIKQLKAQLEAVGADYSDSADQCDRINRALEQLCDLFLDLSVLILKADKVRGQTQEEADKGGISPAVDEMERRAARLQDRQRMEQEQSDHEAKERRKERTP